MTSLRLRSIENSGADGLRAFLLLEFFLEFGELLDCNFLFLIEHLGYAFDFLNLVKHIVRKILSPRDYRVSTYIVHKHALDTVF